MEFKEGSGLVDLPKPLFSDDVDIERIHRRATIVYIHNGAPSEHAQSQYQGDHDPGSFQPHISVNRNSDFARILAAVLKKKINDPRSDGHPAHQAHPPSFTHP